MNMDMDFTTTIRSGNRQIQVTFKQFAALRDSQTLFVVTGLLEPVAMVEFNGDWVFLSSVDISIELLQEALSKAINTRISSTQKN